ncbi:hypothetical protein, partial [Afifella pfennigii]|uniref:hypothetical protein n=1 Tax=Afifella pfennigii TaxID=209897 RepID=UPI001AEC2142
FTSWQITSSIESDKPDRVKPQTDSKFIEDALDAHSLLGAAAWRALPRLSEVARNEERRGVRVERILTNEA